MEGRKGCGYTGTDVGGMPGGPGNMNGNMTPPDGEQNDGMPIPPDGDQDGNRPTSPDGDQDGNRPNPPDGDQDGNRPTPPDGDQDGNRPTPSDGDQDGKMTPPDGQMPNGQNGGTFGEASTEFYMTDKVNAFSGVTDAGTTVSATLLFTDVQNSDWYYDNVLFVYNNGLF